MNAFFKSQFSYFLLVWMYHSGANNGKINRLHERCLRIIYSDKQLSFETLLEKDGSISIHNRNRLKNANSIEAFKIQIKKWKPENCPCRLCKLMFKMSVLFKRISIEGK